MPKSSPGIQPPLPSASCQSQTATHRVQTAPDRAARRLAPLTRAIPGRAATESQLQRSVTEVAQRTLRAGYRQPALRRLHADPHQSLAAARPVTDLPARIAAMR